ncbi:molybdopterin-dependent oxidoreductase [Microbacterium pseudoresistens]|uniref:DMSO/TMAO reductase YedYZ molybdopterin-dependent catalytic subunit n=1 Tax=Microbacterium pseudoresistens TaxID=640634 RepID=A0A7Y9EWP4_9MICO|nr:molybdopterin-dependent oxidoreductase [Microbacterium pseudoresistens]NYD54425.1 DMSO/TMAO reductase YedYZ molybdopterin-dependent catalytic subunit [Microbacterium pseudoresistens]
MTLRTTPTPTRSAGMHLRPAVAGVASAVLGVGIGQLVAVFAPGSAPFAVIGGALIDAAPAWAKDTAIAWFGTADKVALLVGIALVLVLLAAGVGLLEVRRPPVGAVIFGVLGIAVGALALTRANAGLLAWLPSVAAGAAAVVALRLLVRRLPPMAAVRHEEEGAPEPSRLDRRRFLVAAGVTTGIGVIATLFGEALRAGSTAISAVRDAIRLPAASSPAAAPPPDAAEDIPGLSPLITPNSDFYRIDTALIVPSVDPADWSLRIHGMVENEVVLTWDELLALPLIERAVTLSCVSNPVGGSLVGTAVWLGHPIRDLLARAHPLAGADMVLSRSIDGFTAGTPLTALTDERDALLAVGMNGEPLPLSHGFPVRMVVPGLYGYVSATKWVTDLEVTRFDRARAYWTDRGWAAEGPIKLQSRIDVPRAGRPVAAGATVIAGVAWLPGTGVSGVEVQIDDGAWLPATLAAQSGASASADIWAQWSLPWDATPGEHRIQCRAVDAHGRVQTGSEAPPAPDGASGWHSVRVSVDA